MLYHTDGTLMAMVAYPFTTLRTGASLGVAAKHLAPKKIGTLGLVGTGRNALALLEGTLAVRDVGTIKVFSRGADGRQKFAKDASSGLDHAVIAADTCQEVVSEADMLLVATSSLEPVFESSWVKKGCLVASMGPIGELPRDMFLKADRKFVSNLDQEKTPLRPSFLNTQVKEGKIRWEDIDELGEVVSGGKTAPDGTRDLIVFHESAGGAGDIVFADWCYQEAVRKGMGQEVSFF
jgi:ornithine cyclodeaminase/alanine dehydrogenase-like protein (mu-crystallin family)